MIRIILAFTLNLQAAQVLSLVFEGAPQGLYQRPGFVRSVSPGWEYYPATPIARYSMGMTDQDFTDSRQTVADIAWLVRWYVFAALKRPCYIGNKAIFGVSDMLERIPGCFAICSMSRLQVVFAPTLYLCQQVGSAVA